jgi:Tfp pilus assembly protein PilF
LLDNVLAGAKNFADATATKMEILFYNLRFVFIPWPLSWDYSYNQIPIVNWTNILPWLGLLSYGLLLLISILQFKKNPILSFSILYFFISTSPTNNLFFLNGSTFAERFLFTPSLAFAIVIVYIVSKYLKINTKDFSGEKKKLATTIFFTFLILFTGLSISRCPDWQSNFTLFEAGSKTVPNSSRANAAIGSEYMNKAEKESDPDLKKEYIENSIKFYKKSIEVFPLNSDASYKLGLIYYMNGDTIQAINYYKQSLEATPKQIYALNNLGTIYVSRNNVDSAYYYFNRTYLADTTNPMSITNYLIASFNKGYDNQVIYLGNQASKFNYYSKVIYELMSKSYARKGNNEESQKYLQLMNQTLK